MYISVKQKEVSTYFRSRYLPKFKYSLPRINIYAKFSPIHANNPSFDKFDVMCTPTYIRVQLFTRIYLEFGVHTYRLQRLDPSEYC